MLSWGGADPEQTLHALLQAVALLLTPEAGDSASLGIGEVPLLPRPSGLPCLPNCSLRQLHHCGQRMCCEALQLQIQGVRLQDTCIVAMSGIGLTRMHQNVLRLHRW